MSEANPPMVSYAQNFEDIILWRALGHVEGGCYVDIGAQSPDTDSVSRIFYEQGWRGVHVEPTPQYAAQLRERRPDEVVLQALVADKDALSRFFEIPDTGLSTLDEQIALRHKASGFAFRESLVPVLTLDKLFPHVGDRDIHWLKIDVEGAETAVFRGWQAAPNRPWVIVVESTQPLSREQTYQQWEPLVLEKGYVFAYFDGLNRFYVSGDRPELLPAFQAGPNVFDGFVLAPSSGFCGGVNVAYRALELRREAEEAAANARLSEVEACLAVERAEVERLAAETLSLRAEFEVRLQAERERCEAEGQRASTALEQVKSLEALVAGQQRREAELIEELRLRQADVARLAAQAQIEQARMLGLREAHMAQIDRFQSHVAGLDRAVEDYRNGRLAAQSEAHAARHEAHEARHEAHRWWVEAEQLRRELTQIKGSNSWKATAPLRGARRLAGTFVRSPLRTGKQLARPVVIQSMRAVLSVPPLRVAMLRVLDMHPGAKYKLRALAEHAGLVGPRPVAVHVQHALPPAVAHAHVIPKSILQVRTDQVIADLRRAIQEKHG